MAEDSLVNRLLGFLEAQAPGHGVDIVDVEVVGTSKAPVVRVRIDNADESAGTISLDEVAVQNEWISAALDELDPFPGAYTLEVSSPGLARPLRRERDFVRFAGQDVELTTNGYEGRRRFTGRLEGFSDGKVQLSCDDGPHAFSLDEGKKCKIKPNFDAPAKPGKKRK